MEIKKFVDMMSNLIEERLPEAFNEALLVSNRAEAIIYMAMVKCLEEFSDVKIELDEDDHVCAFFQRWSDEGHLSGALSYRRNENGNNELSCQFDLYKIRDSFETLESDLFGSIPGDYSKEIDDSEELPFSFDDAVEIEKGFQKVNLPKRNVPNNE